MRVWEAADDRGAEAKPVDGHANDDGAESLLEREIFERAWRKGIRLSYLNGPEERGLGWVTWTGLKKRDLVESRLHFNIATAVKACNSQKAK